MAQVTREMIEQLRMPNEYRPPQQITNPFAGGMVGGGFGRQQQQSGFIDPQGMVDPEALQAMAWGTDYDIEARRNAIAARIAANQAAQEARTQAQAQVSRGTGADAIGSGMSAGVIPGSGAVVSNYLAPGGAWMDPSVPQPGTDGGSFF